MATTTASQKFMRKAKTKLKSPAYLGGLIWKILRTIILLGLSYVILYPFLVKIISSFMSTADLLDPTVKYFPREPTLEFIGKAIEGMDYWQTLLNTFVLSMLVGVGQLFVSCLGGYGFARFKFPGKNLIFALSMMTLMIPPQTMFIPLFLTFRNFGIGAASINLLNTYAPFIILAATGVGLRCSLYIYLMRQFFRGLPKELEEAAYIDGAGTLRTFFLIIIPNALNMMLTVFLFSFTWQWTETFYTGLFLPNFKILANSVSMLGVLSKDDPIIISTLTNVGCLLIVIPLVILYLFTQRFFVQSMERSGIVG